jgi:hypothetical protein
LIHIGTDEAGYGPLLGPLVIAAAVYEGERRQAPGGGIEDSKEVYGRGGRRALARALSPYLGLGPPVSLTDLLARLSVRGDPRDGYLWYGDVDDPEAGGGAPPATFRRLYVNPVLERDFNAGCARWGDKATLLFEETMRVLRRALDDHPGDATVVCDKHGGRNRYAGLLLAELGPSSILTEREAAACSSYRLLLGGRTVRIRFQQAADATDRAAALASIAAKYTRELFMEALNDFFASRVSGLRRTAGYYGDGRRFLTDVRGVLRDLGCAEETFVRMR